MVPQFSPLVRFLEFDSSLRGRLIVICSARLRSRACSGYLESERTPELYSVDNVSIISRCKNNFKAGFDCLYSNPWGGQTVVSWAFSENTPIRKSIGAGGFFTDVFATSSVVLSPHPLPVPPCPKHLEPG